MILYKDLQSDDLFQQLGSLNINIDELTQNRTSQSVTTTYAQLMP